MIGGVLRGSGRQYIGAIMNFIGYYIIGLPLGITLAIKVKWGVLGLWIGMAMGNIVHVNHYTTIQQWLCDRALPNLLSLTLASKHRRRVTVVTWEIFVHPSVHHNPSLNIR